MNPNQIQTITNDINQAKNINVNEIAYEVYGQKENYGSLLVNQVYTVDEFVLDYDRMLRQLEAEIEDGIGKRLPFSYLFQNDFGNGNLQQDLHSLYSHINGRDFVSAEGFLARLVYYQIQNGFWDKSLRKIHNLKQVELEKKQQEIFTVSKSLSSELKKLDFEKKALEEEKNNLREFITVKQKELETISSSLATVRNQSTEINTSWQNATKLESDLHTLLTSQEKDVVKLKELKTEQEEAFKTAISNASGLMVDIKENLEISENKYLEFNKYIKEIEGKKEFLKQKEQEIIRLTGMAADSSLGSRYHLRETQLDSQVNFWRWAIPITSAVAVAWVILVFNFFQTGSGNHYADLAINLLKTSVGFILLGFVFKQYNKERNIQEEYAFRAAVAMTITAYADILKDEDTEPNKSRQEMVVNAIKQVHTSPKIHTERPSRLFSFNTKDLNESIKNLTEIVRPKA